MTPFYIGLDLRQVSLEDDRRLTWHLMRSHASIVTGSLSTVVLARPR